jgi:hypothetical protein
VSERIDGAHRGGPVGGIADFGEDLLRRRVHRFR